MPPFEPAPPIAPEIKKSNKDRFEIVELFNELRNTPPIGAVGLREFRDLLASLFPEFAAVRDGELDTFLDEYVQETMAPKAPEQNWESNLNSSVRIPRPEPGNIS